MSTVKILVKDGIGQQVNPHDKYIDGSYFNVDWRDFNSSVQSFPVINAKGDGEFEAELVWQYLSPDLQGWTIANDVVILQKARLYETRRAYQIVNADGQPKIIAVEKLAEAYCHESVNPDSITWQLEMICREEGFVAGYNAHKAEEDSKWISVEGRLPEYGGYYLTWVGGFSRPVELYFSDGSFKTIDRIRINITHYQPLPSPPKSN